MKKLNPIERVNRLIGMYGITAIVGPLVFYLKLRFELATLLCIVFAVWMFFDYKRWKKRAEEYVVITCEEYDQLKEKLVNKTLYRYESYFDNFWTINKYIETTVI